MWLRRALFQIHLWLGVLLSLYVVVIGVSGSALVWEDEIQARLYWHEVFD
ncbi:MAG: PepSY domain-containing protein, partial [Terriglobus sp.]